MPLRRRPFAPSAREAGGQLTDSGLVFSPSDLNHFVECEHLTTLDLLAVGGNGVPKERDPQADIVRAKACEHEQAWLQHLRGEDCEIVEIAANGNADWHGDAERTAAAMRDGAEVIYQAVFVDPGWRGMRISYFASTGRRSSAR